MITWVVLPITVAIVTVAMAVWRGRQVHHRCPSCQSEYVLVSAAGQGPNQTYDVLACPFCSVTQTRAQGIASSIAWCPACRNRSLHTTSTRLGGADAVQVEVQEHCPLCEFERTFVVGAGDDARPLGRVIQFPVDRARRARAADEPPPKAEEGG
jgi:hypothetical protein